MPGKLLVYKKQRIIVIVVIKYLLKLKVKRFKSSMQKYGFQDK